MTRSASLVHVAYEPWALDIGCIPVNEKAAIRKLSWVKPDKTKEYWQGDKDFQFFSNADNYLDQDGRYQVQSIQTTLWRWPPHYTITDNLLVRDFEKALDLRILIDLLPFFLLRLSFLYYLLLVFSSPHCCLSKKTHVIIILPPRNSGNGACMRLARVSTRSSQA